MNFITYIHIHTMQSLFINSYMKFQPWQWIFGCFGMLLSCDSFICKLGLMPTFNFYLFLLGDYDKSIFAGFFMILLQIFSFSMLFKMLMRSCTKFFESNLLSFMRTFTLLIGDYNYTDSFDTIPYPYIINFLLFLFILVVGYFGIIMNNAQSEKSDQSKKQSKNKSFLNHVNLVLAWESFLQRLFRFLKLNSFNYVSVFLNDSCYVEENYTENNEDNYGVADNEENETAKLFQILKDEINHNRNIFDKHYRRMSTELKNLNSRICIIEDNALYNDNMKSNAD